MISIYKSPSRFSRIVYVFGNTIAITGITLAVIFIADTFFFNSLGLINLILLVIGVK